MTTVHMLQERSLNYNAADVQVCNLNEELLYLRLRYPYTQEQLVDEGP
jgi:hypothetical protein